jgi:hypothetical protein
MPKPIVIEDAIGFLNWIYGIKSDEESDVRLYPDGRIEFSNYDIERDLMRVDLLGEKPSPAYQFCERYEKYGILMFAANDDLYELFLDRSNYKDIIENEKEQKQRWAEKNICKYLEESLDEFGYTRSVSIYHIMDTFCDSISIGGKDYYVDDTVVEWNAPIYEVLVGELVLKINKKECMHIDVRFSSSYGRSFPSEPALEIEDIDDEDDISHYVKELYRMVYGARYDSSREFEPDEPYKNDRKFKKYNPLKGFDKGKWGLFISDRDGNSFSAVYKTETQTKNSMDYIEEFFMSEEYHYQVFTSEKESEFNPGIVDDEYVYGLTAEAPEGWRELPWYKD